MFIAYLFLIPLTLTFMFIFVPRTKPNGEYKIRQNQVTYQENFKARNNINEAPEQPSPVSPLTIYATSGSSGFTISSIQGTAISQVANYIQVVESHELNPQMGQKEFSNSHSLIIPFREENNRKG